MGNSIWRVGTVSRSAPYLAAINAICLLICGCIGWLASATEVPMRIAAPIFVLAALFAGLIDLLCRFVREVSKR